jgi:hypothetical protein
MEEEIKPIKLSNYFKHSDVRYDEEIFIRHRFLLYNTIIKKIEWVALIGETDKCFVLKNLNTGEKNYIIKEEIRSTYMYVEQLDRVTI